jgi:hypothetical protein
VNWSQSAIFIEKIRNINSMENRMIEKGDRFVTLEGKPNQIIYDRNYSEIILSQLQEISRKMVEHFY